MPVTATGQVKIAEYQAELVLVAANSDLFALFEKKTEATRTPRCRYGA